MKKLILLFSFLFSLTLPGNAQVDVDVLVRNQRFHADTFFFDIFLQRTGSDNLFLGHSDFALDFTEAYFNNPTLNLLSGSTQLYNASGNATSYYDTNIGYDLKYTGINAYRMMIYLNMPTYSNSTQFYDRVARIDATPLTHRIGTFYLTGATNLNTNPELNWKTTGSGLVLNILHRDSATLAAQTADITPVNPALEPQPSVQASGLVITGKTNTTMSLSWVAGNGTGRVLLARSTNGSNLELPTDGIMYDANTLFQSGSELGTSGTFVVYKGADTFATITGLDPVTEYTFYVLEMDGEHGWSENYNTVGVDSAGETTDEDYITVNTKVFLQGAYNTTSGLMNTYLRMGNPSIPSAGTNCLIPSAQPYNTSPWNYAGSENVDTSRLPVNMVDWVLVELRSTASGAAVARRAALLLDDGSIVDTNGVSPVPFPGLAFGSYYIVVKHRNHLPIMSRQAQALNPTSALYDFTGRGQSSAYGLDTLTGLKKPLATLGAVSMMWAGDINNNGIVNFTGSGSDRLLIQNRVVTLVNVITGYENTDINLNRQVTFTGSNNDRVLITLNLPSLVAERNNILP